MTEEKEGEENVESDHEWIIWFVFYLNCFLFKIWLTYHNLYVVAYDVYLKVTIIKKLKKNGNSFNNRLNKLPIKLEIYIYFKFFKKLVIKTNFKNKKLINSFNYSK